MWGMELGEGDYREIGVRDGHHSSSHNQGIRELIENCEKIDKFHSQLFAYYLGKLRSTQDGEGNLLDHSMIVYGSGLSDGMAHDHNNIPVLLAGGGGGKIKGDRHLQYKGLPLSNLHLSLLDVVGIPVEDYLDARHSDATGSLDLTTI